MPNTAFNPALLTSLGASPMPSAAVAAQHGRDVMPGAFAREMQQAQAQVSTVCPPAPPITPTPQPPTQPTAQSTSQPTPQPTPQPTTQPARPPAQTTATSTAGNAGQGSKQRTDDAANGGPTESTQDSKAAEGEAGAQESTRPANRSRASRLRQDQATASTRRHGMAAEGAESRHGSRRAEFERAHRERKAESEADPLQTQPQAPVLPLPVQPMATRAASGADTLVGPKADPAQADANGAIPVVPRLDLLQSNAGAAAASATPDVAGLPLQPPRAASAAETVPSVAAPGRAASSGMPPLAGLAAATGEMQASIADRVEDPQALAIGPQALTALPSFAAEMARAGQTAQTAPTVGTHTPTSAPVAELNLPTPVTAPEFVPRLSGELAVLARDGVQEARVNVHPVELGPISVQIALDGTAAQVHLAVDNARTRELLEQAMPTLAAALRENGLTLTGGGVFQQSRQNSPDNGHPGSGSPGRGTGRDGGDDDGDAALPAAAPRRLRQIGALDVFA